MIFPWQNNQNNLTDEFRKEIIKRFDELIEIADNIRQENLTIGNYWGKINITLELTVIISSTFATIFAFYDVQAITILATIICTISASCLTSLKPSQRELKRRINQEKYRNSIQHTQNNKLLIKTKNITEDLSLQLYRK